MHSNVTTKNVSWPHFSWATLYTVNQKQQRLVDKFSHFQKTVSTITQQEICKQIHFVLFIAILSKFGKVMNIFIRKKDGIRKTERNLTMRTKHSNDNNYPTFYV